MKIRHLILACCLVLFIGGNTFAGLRYSTFFGGVGDDQAQGIAVSGNFAYITGTSSVNSNNIFVAKFDCSQAGLPSLIYSSDYFSMPDSCTDIDKGQDIAIDALGNAYITGYTMSSNFRCTSNALDNSLGGDSDAFLAKIDPSGNVVYCSYVGGSGSDCGLGIAVDGDNNVYICGKTSSRDLYPTVPGCYKSMDITDPENGFVMKFHFTGNNATYSYCTYLGGGSTDEALDIAVDNTGCAYITGFTFSNNFPTLHWYQQYQGSFDAFISKFSSDGSTLNYSTILGGSDNDHGNSIAIDANNDIYIGGLTYGSFPLLNGLPYPGGGQDAFISKLHFDTQLDTLVLLFSTLLGGSGTEEAKSIALHNQYDVYVTGLTTSNETSFPLVNAYDGTFNGNEDAFVSELHFQNNSLSLSYSTFLGGNNQDDGLGIAVNNNNVAFVTGLTFSNNTTFPIVNAYDDSNPLGKDAFLTMIGCIYVPGDANHNGFTTGTDVVYMVNYLKQVGPPPPYQCDCPPHGLLYAECDVNNSCTFNGTDVTYMTAYFKGGPALQPCQDCLPGR